MVPLFSKTDNWQPFSATSALLATCMPKKNLSKKLEKEKEEEEAHSNGWL